MRSPSSVNIDIEKNNMLSVHVPGFLPLMFTTMGYIWGTVGGLPDGNIFYGGCYKLFLKKWHLQGRAPSTLPEERVILMLT